MSETELKAICAEISGTPYDYFKKGYETLLKELKDKGIIKSWYYNGSYNYETKRNKTKITNANETKRK